METLRQQLFLACVLEGALDMSLPAQNRRKDDYWQSNAKDPSIPAANASLGKDEKSIYMSGSTENSRAIK